MDTRCAVVQISDGLVVNIIMADPSDVPPENCQLIEILPDQMCDIGWYYNGTDFIDPNASGE
jgi:hypothetical protein